MWVTQIVGKTPSLNKVAHVVRMYYKIYRVVQKRGHHLIANILKFHDRIAWKLVNFCNIIC